MSTIFFKGHYMNISEFGTHLSSYIERARLARDNNAHHDQRRALFMEFLRDSFGIRQDLIRVEEYIQIKGQPTTFEGTVRLHKGWIDAVFNDIIFEFKRDLKREEAAGLRELKDYLSSIRNGAECFGV